MKMLSKRLRLAVFASLACVASACGQRTIPNTDVEDTSANRDVVEFVEQYRKAVEERNVGALLALASERYYDDNGTPNGEDDVDLAGLREKLARWQETLLDVRYEIRYRRVTRRSDKIFVDYTYTGSFRVAATDGERWARRLADNRLILTKEANEFRILSGM